MTLKQHDASNALADKDFTDYKSIDQVAAATAANSGHDDAAAAAAVIFGSRQDVSNQFRAKNSN